MSTNTDTKTRTVSFFFEKETKNTVKFEEVPERGQPAIMGSLYLQKWVVAQMGDPESLTVTVSPTIPS
jgi:hypothetical protein